MEPDNNKTAQTHQSYVGLIMVTSADSVPKYNDLVHLYLPWPDEAKNGNVINMLPCYFKAS